MSDQSKATIIDGVVLTDKLLSRLKDWQNGDNEVLSMFRNTLSDAICNIALKLDYYEDEDLRNIKDSMSNLAIIKKELKDLEKP